MSKRRKVLAVVDATWEKTTDRFLKEKKEDRWKKSVVVSAQTENQKKYIIAIKNNDIIFCTGPAGSGKTVIPVGLALQDICSPNPTYNKIIIVRPIKEACDEKLGYLPGSLDEKLAVWNAPIFDNMEVFIEKTQIKNLIWEKKIETIPIAFMRGRSFNKSFIICDEIQNASIKQVLLLLTRIGKGSKMVINGDLSQSDLERRNGLEDALERLQGIQKISFVALESSDIVRNPLISTILDRYSNKKNNEPEPEPEPVINNLTNY